MAKQYKTFDDIPPGMIEIWAQASERGEHRVTLETAGQAISLRVRLYMARQAIVRLGALAMFEGEDLRNLEILQEGSTIRVIRSRWLPPVEQSLQEVGYKGPVGFEKTPDLVAVSPAEEHRTDVANETIKQYFAPSGLSPQSEATKQSAIADEETPDEPLNPARLAPRKMRG